MFRKKRLVNYYLSLPIKIKRLILKELHDDYDFSSYTDDEIEEIFKKVVEFYV